MLDSTNKTAENQDSASLLTYINELESALLAATKKEQFAMELAAEFQRLLTLVKQENEKLLGRNKTLEDPEGIKESGLGWLSRIVLLIRRVGRPMRAKEIIHELLQMEEEAALMRWMPHQSYMAVVLSKGVKSGRLKLFAVQGTRGGYYAVEDWVDNEGNLAEDMKRQLV